MAVLHLSVVSADAAGCRRHEERKMTSKVAKTRQSKIPWLKWLNNVLTTSGTRSARAEGAAGLLAVHQWPVLHWLAARPVPTFWAVGFCAFGLVF